MYRPSAISLLDVCNAILNGQLKAKRRGDWVELSRKDLAKYWSSQSPYRRFLDELGDAA